MQAHIQLFAVIFLSVYSQIMMKSRADRLASLPDTRQGYVEYLYHMAIDWRVMSAVCATFVAGVLWLLVIRKLELGYAFPFMALSFVLVPIAAWLVLREPLPPLQLLGLGLVMIGVTISAVTR